MVSVPTPPAPSSPALSWRIRARSVITVLLSWFATRLRPALRGEAGVTTAEYAVGTVAACAFGAVLYKVVTSGAVSSALTAMIRKALTVGF